MERKEIIEKLLEKSTLNPESGCFEWNGLKSKKGYGKRTIAKKTWRLHRLAYRLFNGPLLDGKIIMHTCDNPCCWNSEHLVQGTHMDNVRDKISKGRFRNGNTGKTHCLRGHEFTTDNIYIDKRGPWRSCKKCVTITNNRRKAANK